MRSANTSRPLFIDTNAFVALFDEDDEHYEAADTIFNRINRGELPYGPLFTSRYVLAETATAIRFGVGHREAVEALSTVRNSSSINVLEAGGGIFDRTATQFEQYDDQMISFVDHMNAVLADEYDIDHIFAFDSDFATLDLIRVPVDTGDM